VAERATIARPYAKAAFEYARDAKAFADWSQGLRTAAEIVSDSRLAALTKSPQWSQADLVSIIADVAGAKLNPAMQNFVRVLAENHRLLLLPEISAHFEELRSAVENTVDVEVISAIALNSAQADKLGITFRVPLERRIAGAEKVGKHKTSMLQDVEAGRALELEALVGSVVELGRLTRTPTPHIDAVYALTDLLARTIAADRRGS